MTKNENTDIVICGVGGQGVILASKVLATAALLQGFDVKASEVHGMAQRGGSVLSQVRIGKEIFSPTIPLCKASTCLSFEELEALRYLPYLKEKAMIVVNNKRIDPLLVELKQAKYPENVIDLLKEKGFNVSSINGEETLKEKGFPLKALNILLLGVASKTIPIAEEFFLTAIEKSVPLKTVEINKEVFMLGRSF
ncbi:MAG: indolepyruvate oxidoreductase subunit beta [Candidatus Aureabacteria bacterium]|nr:indolepyruvate oxidoreductase subunit beta [Candidatus Auribacterota bacterium]